MNTVKRRRTTEPDQVNACAICKKSFSSHRHLQRHWNTHKSSSVQCEFCHEFFSRSDVRASHYVKCPKRGANPIPPAAQRGRKRHVCEECSRRKVRCDGAVPCSRCTEHGRSCVNPGTEDVINRQALPLHRVDQGSINFILNKVEFLQKFPKASTSPKISPIEEYVPSSNGGSIVSNNTVMDHSHGYYKRPLVQGEGFLKNLSFNKTYAKQTSLNHQEGPSTSTFSAFWNQAMLYTKASELRKLLEYAIRDTNSHNAEVYEAVEIVTPQNIDASIALYFRHWHKHAPIIHEATFNPCTASTSLVLALFSLGGMYFKDDTKIMRLKLLLDTMETVIFCGITANNHGISGWDYGQDPLETAEDWHQSQLENVQGTYLFAVLQYWTGSTAARERVRQVRFIQIAQMFRHLELLVKKHTKDETIQDEISFRRWIRTESAIRLSMAATMLDNTFGIFNNVAPRFQWSEIDLNFPSDDAYFRLTNYEELIKRNMSPRPKSTMAVKASFAILFTQNSSIEMEALRAGSLTAWDLQVLLYFLYTHLWTAAFNNPPFGVLEYSRSTGVSVFGTALANWKELWDEVRNADQEWDSTRFQNLAEDYYTLIQGVMLAVENKSGLWPAIPSDCEQGAHLKIVLDQMGTEGKTE